MENIWKIHCTQLYVLIHISGNVLYIYVNIVATLLRQLFNHINVTTHVRQTIPPRYIIMLQTDTTYKRKMAQIEFSKDTTVLNPAEMLLFLLFGNCGSSVSI